LEVICHLVQSLIEKRDAALAKAEAIVEAAQAEARELTPEQDAEIAVALDEVRSLDEQIQNPQRT
jgi:phage-related protein